ncbi:MAG: AAA family ATPase [Butyrivibrio sp.]|nr:AAA family ATPase [Butyrivibrio sp.]
MDKRIQEIQNEIDRLPKGGVTKKNINNTYYFYHQWKDEAGKRHYDVVAEAEFNSLKADIERRRELEKRLKALIRELGERNVISSEVLKELRSMNTNVMYGDALQEMASIAGGYQRRECFDTISRYLKSGNTDKVCILYGLRRTGKTTLIRQLILDMDEEDFTKTIYIKATQADNIAGINKDLKALRDLGYKYAFIDEVTLISDFIDSASLFSDVYAAGGMKIVLSGTDSLGMYFAANEELYDRAVMVHTTFIPFREHSRLLGINSVDEYIRYGGTLKPGELGFENEEANAKEASFRDDESTRRYIDTAISRNIQHSLALYEGGGHFRHLKKLYEADELTNAINRIIQDMNHEFTKEVILKRFVSRDLRSSAQLLRSASDESLRTDALDGIDTSEVIAKLKKILGILEKDELTEPVTQAAADEIREYLKALDLIEYADVETTTMSDEQEGLRRIIFTQPGMRYCQAEALVYSLMRSSEFKTLSEREKMLIANKILEDVRGIMLEDIVFLETQKTLPRSKKLFKIQFDVGEFDMVIYDIPSDTCEVYEIKHSSKADKNQLKHLLRKECCALTEKKYGTISGKFVLYNGESGTIIEGCEYRNVVEYLKGL